MIRIVPLQAQHILDILSGGVIECGLRVTDPNDAVRQLAQQSATAMGSATALDDDRPLICAVLKRLWDGVAQLDALISVDFPQRKIAACRVARDGLRDLIETNRLHRVQTTVRCDFPAGQRFAEWLGFRPEGLARKYNYDEVDSLYYAIVR